MKNLYETIARFDIFVGMKPEHLGILAEGAKMGEFNAGDVLSRERGPANQFYLVECGKIALEAHEPANGTMLVQTVGPGEVRDGRGSSRHLPGTSRHGPSSR